MRCQTAQSAKNESGQVVKICKITNVAVCICSDVEVDVDEVDVVDEVTCEWCIVVGVVVDEVVEVVGVVEMSYKLVRLFRVGRCRRRCRRSRRSRTCLGDRSVRCAPRAFLIQSVVAVPSCELSLLRWV